MILRTTHMHIYIYVCMYVCVHIGFKISSRRDISRVPLEGSAFGLGMN